MKQVNIYWNGKIMSVSKAAKSITSSIEKLAKPRAVEILTLMGNEFILDAQKNKEYRNFTGNTITSICFGLYDKGRLTDTVFLSGLKEPVHEKVDQGEILTLNPDYDGNERTVMGSVPIVTDYGKELSIYTLKNTKPKGNVAIVVTTGTEYSEYLEFELNVLTETYEMARKRAKRMFASYMKKMINGNDLKPSEDF